MSFDPQAAMHCARITLGEYRRAWLDPPGWLTEHLRQLEAAMSGRGPDCEPAQEQSGHDFIDAHEAAAIVGCTARHIRRIAADLDGKFVARGWVFNRRYVIDYAIEKGHNENERAS